MKEEEKTKIVQGVMEVLHLKKGAAYKRMSGETAMTIEEVVQLADHFNVSLDSIFRSEKYASFEHPFVNKTNPDHYFFMEQYKRFISPLKDKDPERKIELTYMANELPVFYYFSYKYIFNFLMTLWKNLHWEDGRLEISMVKDIEDQADRFREEMLDNYYGHHVTEIWNSNMLSNLYQQIIFCITIRAFADTSYIERLVKDVEHLINHLRDVSVSGVKSIKGAHIEGSQLNIYLNDFANYLNVVLFESKFYEATFIGYDYPQFIISYNPAFYTYSKDWVNKLKKRSVLISSEGYQYRELFLLKMENDYKSFCDKIEKLLPIYYPN